MFDPVLMAFQFAAAAESCLRKEEPPKKEDQYKEVEKRLDYHLRQIESKLNRILYSS